MSGGSLPSSSGTRELVLRVVSAVILAVFALFVTWQGGYPFTLLCAVGAVLILTEYAKICSPSLPIHVKFAAFGTLLLAIAAVLTDQTIPGMIIVGIGVSVLSAWEWLIRKSVWGALGLLYAALPFFAMISFRGGDAAGLAIILVMFACVWGADTFAYFAGRLIGGPKLAPRISPKKTWAGYFGGLLGAVLVSLALTYWLGYHPGVAFVVLVLVLATISQIGDLLESALKRRFDVKDSGSLIPGHGGVLDRIDGLITVGVSLWLAALAVYWVGGSSASYSQIVMNAFLLP